MSTTLIYGCVVSSCKEIPRTLTHGLAAVLNAVATLPLALFQLCTTVFRLDGFGNRGQCTPSSRLYLFAEWFKCATPSPNFGPDDRKQCSITIHSNLSDGRTHFPFNFRLSNFRRKEGKGEGKKSRMDFVCEK